MQLLAVTVVMSAVSTVMTKSKIRFNVFFVVCFIGLTPGPSDSPPTPLFPLELVRFFERSESEERGEEWRGE